MADSFNNPPQPTSQLFSTSNGLPHASSLNNGDNSNVPRPKRIACVVCRRRKLRCDGKRPSCGTCSRLGHECAYDEARRKSGPKRGYVKELEARLGMKCWPMLLLPSITSESADILLKPRLRLYLKEATSLPLKPRLCIPTRMISMFLSPCQLTLQDCPSFPRLRMAWVTLSSLCLKRLASAR